MAITPPESHTPANGSEFSDSSGHALKVTIITKKVCKEFHCYSYSEYVGKMT